MVLKIFVNENGIKKCHPFENFEFLGENFMNFSFSLFLLTGGKVLPKVEFCPRVLLFSAGGVKEKRSIIVWVFVCLGKSTRFNVNGSWIEGWDCEKILGFTIQ